MAAVREGALGALCGLRVLSQHRAGGHDWLVLEGSLEPPFWRSPLQIEYFNNATIVELVEQPRRGILAVLDEACSTAGPITDRIFLQTLDTHHRHHPHYSSRQVF